MILSGRISARLRKVLSLIVVKKDSQVKRDYFF